MIDNLDEIEIQSEDKLISTLKTLLEPVEEIDNPEQISIRLSSQTELTDDEIRLLTLLENQYYTLKKYNISLEFPIRLSVLYKLLRISKSRKSREEAVSAVKQTLEYYAEQENEAPPALSKL